MILIDKQSIGASPTVNIVLTLGDVSASSSFTLNIHSSWDNKDYAVPLGANVSPFPFRYDMFNPDSTVFNQLKAGRYSYSIAETDTGSVVETGTLTVFDPSPEEYVSTDAPQSSDDYISY